MDDETKRLIDEVVAAHPGPVPAFRIYEEGEVVAEYPIKSMTLTNNAPPLGPLPTGLEGKFEVSGTIVCRWGEAEGDPFADIQRWRDEFMALDNFTPNRIIMPHRWWMRLARGTMTKRRWRRFRGKLRAAWKAAR